MKKLLYGVMVLVLAVALTGCSFSKDVVEKVKKEVKSELNCKQEMEQSGIKIAIDFNVDFLGTVIKDIDFSYDMDLTQFNDAQIEAVSKTDLCTTVKNTMSQYKEAITGCDQNVENKHMIVKLTMDINKVAETPLQKLSKPSDAKEALEKEGYTCTINKDE